MLLGPLFNARPLFRIITVPAKETATTRIVIAKADVIPALFLKLAFLKYNVYSVAN